MKHKWDLRKLLVIGIFVFSLLLAAGCSASQSTENQQTLETVDSVSEPTPEGEMQEEAPVSTVEEAQQNTTNVPVDEAGESSGSSPSTPTVVDTSGSATSPSPVPEESTPPPLKTALEATDPSTVELGVGKPQLIEFFAFW
jgi:hypothetical protein